MWDIYAYLHDTYTLTQVVLRAFRRAVYAVKQRRRRQKLEQMHVYNVIHDEQPKPWRSFKVRGGDQQQSLFDYEAQLRARNESKSGLAASKLPSDDVDAAHAHAQVISAQASLSTPLNRTCSVTRTQSNERAQRENAVRNRYKHSASPIVAACLQGNVKVLNRLLAATSPGAYINKHPCSSYVHTHVFLL
jgi:hypothetical protein